MTTHPHSGFRLTFGDSLSYGQLRQVCYLLRAGGLVVLPSDTCYALAGLPLRRDVISKIITALPEKKDSEIPLSFGSLAMVEKWVVLKPKDYRAIEKYCPGALTLVCKINPHLDVKKISEHLHTEGTIGVRIPDSPVERQLSVELDSPITTCAIRDDSSKPITKYDDAMDLVRSHLAGLPEGVHLASIQMRWLKYNDLSTVVSLAPSLAAPYTVRVYRPGIISPEEIEDTVQRWSYWDVEEFT